VDTTVQGVKIVLLILVSYVDISITVVAILAYDLGLYSTFSAMRLQT